MDTDFRFACAECGFDCAGDGWDKYWSLKAKKRICKKEFVKTLQKIFISVMHSNFLYLQIHPHLNQRFRWGLLCLL